MVESNKFLEYYLINLQNMVENFLLLFKGVIMATAPNTNDTTLAGFIWKVADDLWGDFPHTDFGKIILPFTVLRRLECVLEPTRDKVVETYDNFKDQGIPLDAILCDASGQPFYNTSKYSLSNLGSTKTLANLKDYISSFSENVVVIFNEFDFETIINRLSKANLLYRICDIFANIDLHPNTVPDRTMSNVYEHLIARFGAEVGTGSEDFMTPRDIVHLAATLLLDPDDKLFAQEDGLIRTIYDQTCGTGGFLTDMMNHVATFKDNSKVAPVLIPYGQELQPETHAVALGSMLLKKLESDPSRDLSQNIKQGSTLSDDKFRDKRFHYQCSNPPFGMSWAKDADAVQKEHKDEKANGRFEAGLPKVSDGSMLFLQNLVSKLETPENGGGRGAIVLSGSPLFNGDKGSVAIRRYILENDFVEAIISLPTSIFFRTGINTYIWMISNRKPVHRKGKIQLIDATNMGSVMRKNEGNKRIFIDQAAIDEISRIYADFQESKVSKIFHYTEFGYREVKVGRPLRLDIEINDEKINKFKLLDVFKKLKEADQKVLDNYLNSVVDKDITHNQFFEGLLKAWKKPSKAILSSLTFFFGVKNSEAEPAFLNGDALWDKELEDFERIPYNQDIDDYIAKEVLPHAPDAVVDETYIDEKDGKIGKVGYEINFTRNFYEFETPRNPIDVMQEIKVLSSEVAKLLGEI